MAKPETGASRSNKSPARQAVARSGGSAWPAESTSGPRRETSASQIMTTVATTIAATIAFQIVASSRSPLLK